MLFYAFREAKGMVIFMRNSMLDIIKLRQEGKKVGIYSACTATKYVIEAVMEAAMESETYALIEATANQSNQYGGYTGMKPADFVVFIENIAENLNFPKDKLILGGDHLGPLTWQKDNEVIAMEKSKELIRQYVLANFTKIHIDTSMMLADDDKSVILSDEIIAHRAAILAKTSEEAYAELLTKNPNAPAPVYIIGSEVPIPGGAQENEDSVSVTKPEQFKATLKTFKEVFEAQGLNDAFSRVIGIVVQPGVEFADASIIEYNRIAAKELCSVLDKNEGIVFEGHSTDYQTRYKLKEMVEDGIAILKVGPALTFGLREGIFALEGIEKELLADSNIKLSNFRNVLENIMIEKPENWQKHYRGDESQRKFKRMYSFSDRCRYYLPEEKVNQSLEILIKNINSIEIPVSILSQYMPMQYLKYREGKLQLNAEALIKGRIRDYINDYLYACKA